MYFEKVRKIISDQLEVDEEIITMESSFEDDFNADSLDLVDLAMTIEDEFKLEVPQSELEKIKTVGDVVRFLDSQ